MTAAAQRDGCWFGGVASEDRGLAAWTASLNLDQGLALYDLLAAGDDIDECFENVSGSVRFDSGEVHQVCRFNVVRNDREPSRIWVDYLLDGESPDAPSQDVEAVQITDQLATDMGSVLGLVLGGMVDAEQIALCANAGISADEWSTMSVDQPHSLEGAAVLGALRPSSLVASEGWVELVRQG